MRLKEVYLIAPIKKFSLMFDNTIKLVLTAFKNTHSSCKMKNLKKEKGADQERFKALLKLLLKIYLFMRKQLRKNKS